MPLSRIHLLSVNILLLLSLHWQFVAAAAMPSPVDRPHSEEAAASGPLTPGLIIKFAPALSSKLNQAAANVTEAEQRAVVQAAVNAQLQTLSSVAGMELTYNRALTADTYVVSLPQPIEAAQAATMAETLMARATALGLVYVEPDHRRQAQLTPTDPLYEQQWHLQTFTATNDGISMADAWNITTGSSAVVIAVLDTGIRFEHPDFTGRTVAGYDFVDDAPTANDGDARDSDPSDPGDWITAAENRSGPFRGCGTSDSSWHGSHVAGILGAAGNDGVGIAGVTWQSPLLPVRVLGKCGGLISDIADALRWAAGIDVAGVPHNNHPARVINLSLSGAGACSNTEQNAINDVINQGAVVVVAAGNSNQDAASYSPGNCNGVINVAATNRGGNKAGFSNYGAAVALSAPGGDNGGDANDDILSTIDLGTQSPAEPGYAYYAGTSMASPQVAGIAALMLAVNPNLTPGQIGQLLRTTVNPFPAGSSCTTTRCGAGIVNALAAVNAAANVVPTATPAPTATATPRPTVTPTSTPTLAPTATIDVSLPFTDTRFLPLIHNRSR
jgi:serine protease